MSKKPYVAKGMAVKKMKAPSTPAHFSEYSSSEEDDDDNDTDFDIDVTQMDNEDNEEMGQRLPSQSSDVLLLREESTEVVARDSSEGGNGTEDILTQKLYLTDHIHAASSQLSTQETQQTEELQLDPSQDIFHEGQTVAAPTKKKRRRSHAVVILPEHVERAMGEWLEHEGSYFYDKKHPLYRDNKKKREELERMGASFNPPVCAEDLSQWIITARTRYFYLYFFL